MPERPPFSPVIALLTVSSVWDARLNASLKDLGLTTRKYGLLAHIHATPGISFSELARRSQITVQTAHTAVRTLQDEGLVQDATAQAGAASDLRATDKGEAALAEADARLASLDGAFGEGAPRLTEALQGLHEEPFGA
ncbi:MarR family winged helix-turn-helix transcriptional regulator [Microbacterium sp. B2969]|uniref:MarR family winged helix-turn-helix transcriptional regulator n=1 Tax=Microbacterium alkaliflavum TaxID=3248839 RepID=A0ABW7Q420_9MICO